MHCDGSVNSNHWICPIIRVREVGVVDTGLLQELELIRQTRLVTGKDKAAFTIDTVTSPSGGVKGGTKGNASPQYSVQI